MSSLLLYIFCYELYLLRCLWISSPNHAIFCSMVRLALPNVPKYIFTLYVIFVWHPNIFKKSLPTWASLSCVFNSAISPALWHRLHSVSSSLCLSSARSLLTLASSVSRSSRDRPKLCIIIPRAARTRTSWLRMRSVVLEGGKRFGIRTCYIVT